MTLTELKKQITKETQVLIRIGEKPLHDFRPEAYNKDYSNTIACVGATPKQYSRIIQIIQDNNYIINGKYHDTDINHNQVSYLTLKKRNEGVN